MSKSEEHGGEVAKYGGCREMKTIPCVGFVCLMLCVAGCVTGYGKKGWRFGYSDRRVDDNTFLVSFDANAYTPQPTLQAYVLLRCAQVTIEAGYDYFIIVERSDTGKAIPVVIPGSSTSYTTGSGSGYSSTYGNMTYGSASGSAVTTTQSSPGYAFGVRLPGSTVMIKAFHGKKPDDNPMAYDALAVIRYVEPQVKR